MVGMYNSKIINTNECVFITHGKRYPTYVPFCVSFDLVLNPLISYQTRDSITLADLIANTSGFHCLLVRYTRKRLVVFRKSPARLVKLSRTGKNNYKFEAMVNNFCENANCNYNKICGLKYFILSLGKQKHRCVQLMAKGVTQQKKDTRHATIDSKVCFQRFLTNKRFTKPLEYFIHLMYVGGFGYIRKHELL